MTRSESKYINMRKFHGTVKKIITKKCIPITKQKVKLFDVSIGRFGDLHNYELSGIGEVTGIDPDNDSIEEALRRYNNMKGKYKIKATISKQTISDKKINVPNSLYDIVACNFTLHYLFEKEEFLKNTLKNISSRLKQNGYFIGTTIDGDKLEQLHGNNDIFFETCKNFGEKDISFGKPYKFNLMDTKDSGNYFDKHIHNDLEYRVSIKVFTEYASMYGLKLLEYKPFEEYEYDRTKFSKNEKLVSSLYGSFIFIKNN